MRNFIRTVVAVFVLLLLGTVLFATNDAFKGIALSVWHVVAPWVLPFVARIAHNWNPVVLGDVFAALVVVGLLAWAFIRPGVKPAGKIPR